MAYPNPASQDAQAYVGLKFGFRVARAAGNTAQTGVIPIFTIAGGRVVVLGIVGQVTTILEAAANAVKLIANPTTGTDVDLCATVETNGKEAGTLLGITGTFATALVAANAGATVLQATAIVVNVGTIDQSSAASRTGQIAWTLWYLPLDEGATVVAA